MAKNRAPATALKLETLIRGCVRAARFLDLLQHFIVLRKTLIFGSLHKDHLPAYHQFHAVNAGRAGNRARQRIGARRRQLGRQAGATVAPAWCGTPRAAARAFSMLSMPPRICANPAMANPTLVVLTIATTSIDQLFRADSSAAPTSSGKRRCSWPPNREQCASCSNRASGALVFTTIQKFMPEKGAAECRASAPAANSW